MTLTIAILGKPNVGKSTLFNKLCGKKVAITDDRPGVTRDFKIFSGSLIDLDFDLIDTAGYEKSKDMLATKMSKQTFYSLKSAQLIFFIVDAKHGLDSVDLEFARLIRKYSKPIILIANKAEGKCNLTHDEAYKLGFGTPIFISAEHKLGFNDLYFEIKSVLKKENEPLSELKDENLPAENEKGGYNLKVAILGRPNVGKSSLLNCIAGFERSIVSEISGTTRDSISHIIKFNDRDIELIDTAGMRKKNKIDDKIEALSVSESINTIRRANIVVLIIDATQPLEQQDLSIANLIIEEGKAIVLVINKSDLIPDRAAFLKDIEYEINAHLYRLKGVPTILISAKNNYNITSIFKAIFVVEKSWHKKISTSEINSWLRMSTEKHIPPLANNGRRIRLKYAVQTAIKPPTFTIFANMPADLPQSYSRYLEGELRSIFGFDGTPIRLRYKKNANPYDESSKKS